MKRTPSGIIGLDEHIQGGMPVGRSLLLSGAPGTGKTIFSMQYLYHGALNDEPGIYVSLDETPNNLREDAKVFGWNLKKLENQNKLAIIDASSARIGIPSEERFSIPEITIDIDRLLLKIMQVAENIKAKRVVIDSIAGLGFQLDSENETRKAILKASYMLSTSGLTSILTSEVPPSTSYSNVLSKYGVEEYTADAVILLNYYGGGMESPRTLFIRKMRGTRHTEDILPMSISQNGITILQRQD